MSPSLVSQFRGSHWYGAGKTKVDFGPFVGGLNTAPDRYKISPNELSECVNYLVKQNGALVARPKAVYQIASAVATASGKSHRSLGSVSNGGYSWPLFSMTTATATTFWYFRPDLGTWNQAFTDLASSHTPKKYLFYNNFHWVVTDDLLYRANGTGAGSVLTSMGGFATVTGNGSLWNGVAIDAFLLKDRLVVVTPFGLAWSKATDPSVWAAPDGGYVLNPGNDIQYSAVAFQDSIYIFGSAGIWRFTWSSDPSVDATFEQIYFDSAWNGTVLNNELYFCTDNGVYKYINGFAVEISEKIRSTYQTVATLIGTGSPVDSQGGRPGIFVLDNLLLVGPFNVNDVDLQPIRSGVFVNARAANWYYVYDVDLKVWTNWLFSAEATSPIGGPTLPPLQAGKNYSNDTYYWVTALTISGTMRTAVISMSASDLAKNNTSNGYDVGVSGNTWIGFRFATAILDLGDATIWKRLVSGILDAVLTSTSFATGTSQISLFLNGNTFLVPGVSPDVGRLQWGTSYRFKTLGFIYDCLNGITISGASTPNVEINSIRGFITYITTSRKITT